MQVHGLKIEEPINISPILFYTQMKSTCNELK
jgi:hypothetical protein